MAKAPAPAAAADDAPPVKKGPSLIMQLVMLLIMTGAAGGIGWVSGGYLTGGGGPADAGVSHAAAGGGHGETGGHGEAAADGHGEAAEVPPGHPTIIPMAPITTNLAAPAETWVRMEASLVFDKAPDEPGLADSIHQDLLAFLRTVKMHQIEGASGFQHLKADLDERASVRSDGQVRRVLIRTLLFE